MSSARSAVATMSSFGASRTMALVMPWIALACAGIAMPGLISDWNTTAPASSTTPISTSRSVRPMPVVSVSRNKVTAGSGFVCQPVRARDQFVDGVDDLSA